jgi:hypothetical protein
MSTWRQTGPSRWIVGTIQLGRELDDRTIIDLFNTDYESAPGNPAITVSDVDQFYTCEIDHNTYEIEATVTITRRYDQTHMLTQGLDTP